MMNLAEYRRRSQSLADFLPWAALVREGVILNKDRTPSDLTPQIAKRAYDLYERRGRQDGRAVQDWGQAEREIRKDEPHE